MTDLKKPYKAAKVFPTAEEDVGAAKLSPSTPQTSSPAYRLAYSDNEFLLRDELRPLRLQLELLKPDLLQDEQGIEATVVVFGSARIPDAETAANHLAEAKHKAEMQPNNSALLKQVAEAERVLRNSFYYEEARKFARLITQDSASDDECDFMIITGGGPGIMEAANRGAMEAGGKSIGLNIVLPFEQRPNPYVTPELCFQFHYFAIRKMHFLKRARALLACPGGFGTLDELFETLTLIQTKKIKPLPVLLMGSDYWRRMINFEMLVEEGMIEEQDLALFQFVDSAEQARDIVRAHWGI
ncbi:TIGR00730 family Rossman fold protein [Dasania sp. GY-MA-18]|uniref:Cytokinin riboside 5'-monophosphate phosphoribohydrolase n=1 Tax=Dasania phycosphaerae TaxID=2950436 RepID=A0A9J6RNQ0_9GAMM|nr:MULTISPECIES: TIGR00730 family Rossman fold protein [Dasania]MCR8923335.1 TIGR00730 family Rossman fold protein [Dasania sp. GY-MA-18]MCZ0865767.1 TIGR00730 family Rossman fold protein [Dasania phycosphaerae]MCZ0869492.1 TIGR00730 family Rossman fold protein [Dasania phycosphaerae]